MPEVVRLLLAEMESDRKVYRISAICHVDNTRSARVLEGAGLSLEGRLVRHTVFPNISTGAAGCPAVRQGGQVTTPRTAHARAAA